MNKNMVPVIKKSGTGKKVKNRTGKIKPKAVPVNKSGTDKKVKNRTGKIKPKAVPVNKSGTGE